MVKIGYKRVLIVSVDVSDNITKYKGCYYPQGIESYGDLIEFSHKEIDACYFMGWWNEAMKYKAGYGEEWRKENQNG